MNRFGATLVCSLLAACGTATPCHTCPAVDGTYTVRWEPDGGPNPQCPGPRVPSWVLMQRDSQVTSTIGGIAMGGTLFDSYDLLVTGAEQSLTYRLKAIAIPEGSSADAGMRLLGTFTTRTPSTDGGNGCESNEPFTAQRSMR